MLRPPSQMDQARKQHYLPDRLCGITSKDYLLKARMTLAPAKTMTTKHPVTSWAAGIGYAIFLNDFVAIEPSVSYTDNTTKYSAINEKSSVAGFEIGVGFQIYLGSRN